MSLSPYTLQVAWEQVDIIIVKELKSTLDSFKGDLKRAKNGEGCGVFVSDHKEDAKKIKEMVKAIELLLTWYGGSKE